MLFARILEKTIKTGRLTLIDGDGRRHVFQGERPGPAATLRIHDRALHWKRLTNPMPRTRAELSKEITWAKSRTT